MLCKFVARVLQPSDIPCFRWFASQYCQGSLPHGAGYKDTAMWKGFKGRLPLVISSSCCSVGAGSHVFFWYDQWLGSGCLRYKFPTLCSFVFNQFCSVRSQFTEGFWNVRLWPNLSHTAAQELLELNQLLTNVTPSCQH